MRHGWRRASGPFRVVHVRARADAPLRGITRITMRVMMLKKKPRIPNSTAL